MKGSVMIIYICWYAFVMVDQQFQFFVKHNNFYFSLTGLSLSPVIQTNARFTTPPSPLHARSSLSDYRASPQSVSLYIAASHPALGAGGGGGLALARLAGPGAHRPVGSCRRRPGSRRRPGYVCSGWPFPPSPSAAPRRSIW